MLIDEDKLLKKIREWLEKKVPLSTNLETIVESEIPYYKINGIVRECRVPIEGWIERLEEEIKADEKANLLWNIVVRKGEIDLLCLVLNKPQRYNTFDEKIFEKEEKSDEKVD